jgi:hypothetical protein
MDQRVNSRRRAFIVTDALAASDVEPWINCGIKRLQVALWAVAQDLYARQEGGGRFG